MDILVIPDGQNRPEKPISHYEALGNFVIEFKPDYIVNLGDHWDMHSLSSYDMGKKSAEGARYQEDIDIGKEAIEIFEKPIRDYNSKMTLFKKKKYYPRKIFTMGNHEQRMNRHVESNPYLAGKLSIADFGLTDWEVYEFLEVVNIEGILFSHYLVNPDTLTNKPFACLIDTQLKLLGFSFVQGHSQGLKIASPRYLQDGRVIRGIKAGSFYQYDPEYLGPQGNDYWRGALLLEDVKDGMYRLKELPLSWLIENYL